ncbi:FapA family protein [Saccharibacillus sp. JS10]|uniref:FapA family protein n=1 Tax=Saccharibacillus sp. JS10 TaxID=2950552 RepID=UPI00210D4F4C|nr:FapA family protein [Saccharibacillus sp. JS10]MCQ4086201.1 FapA family protein [Saccharibacillus sp. JS10]
MERSIITRAKNAELAVEEALKLLAVSREQVQIEVIDPGGKGVLGLGARLTVVKVTVLSQERNSSESASIPVESAEIKSDEFREPVNIQTDQVSSPSIPPSPSQSVSSSSSAALTKVASEETSIEQGGIGIRGGKFWIQATGSRLPLLTPPVGAVLYRNGSPVEGKISVAPDDELELESEPIREEGVWKIEIDDACLKAKLHIRPGFEKTFTLQDSKLQAHLVVPVSEQRRFLPIDQVQVVDTLKELGVVYGIRPSEIGQACQSQQPGVFVIAEGTPAVQGANGTFTTNFETETKRMSPQSREDGTIDYREIVEFPTSIEGQVLVRTLPAKPGRPGRDLMDRPIQPIAVHSIELAAGEGVSITEDGRRAVAIRSGMPRVKQQGFRLHLSVLPKLSHRGDVDMKSGNIRFRGDVEISGGVHPGMKVEATGSIAIRGAVESATVEAAYSLIASGNLIHTQVSVGKRNEFFDQVEPLLLEISSQTQSLQSAIEQLGQTAAFKLNDLQKTGLGALLSVLLRGKFKTLQVALTRFSEQATQNEAQLDEEWKSYAHTLKYGFLDLRQGGLRDVRELDAFRLRTLQLAESVIGPEDRPIFAELQYVQNSHVSCGGNVRIAKGAYNAAIYCQGELEAKGTVRGGVYFAAKGIILKEVGAPGGIVTKLQVPEKAFVRAQVVMEGTVVQVGRRSFQFIEAASNIHARLDHNGELLLF